MKILFIASVWTGDYMQDALLHGLKTIFGNDVVDIPRVNYMYKDDPCEPKELYGTGFTLFKLLPDLDVDRSDIETKIKRHFFDVVIYGSVHRNHDYFGEVLSTYSPQEIIFIDGEDGPQFLTNCVNYGWYFKRELHTSQYRVHPIQFAIPEEKISDPLPKIRLIAHLDPMNKLTYIYNNERAYYDAYRESMFGITMRKAGWDCMRHIEIMACGCIPYFRNLEHCPPTIMERSPKAEMLIAKNLLEYQDGRLFNSSAGHYVWEELNFGIQKTLREKLTTTALARYVFDTVGRSLCLRTTTTITTAPDHPRKSASVGVSR